MKHSVWLVTGLMTASAVAGPAPVSDAKVVDSKVVAAAAESRPRWWVAVGVDYMSARLNFNRDAWNPNLDKPDIDTYVLEIQPPRVARDVEVIDPLLVEESRSSSRSGGDFDFGGRQDSWGPLLTVGYNFAQTAGGDFGISLNYAYHSFGISDKDTTGKAKYSQEVTSYYIPTEFPPIDIDNKSEKAVVINPEVWDSEKKTYTYKRTETGSFDVQLHTLPLLLNYTVGNRWVKAVAAVGPTLDIYNWDLDHTVKWKASGGGDSKKKHSSGSDTTVSVGLLAKLGLQVSLEPSGRWFIEGAATYRVTDGFTANAGDASATFDADGFGGQAAIGFRF